MHHEIQKGLILAQDKLSIEISVFSGLQWNKTQNTLSFLSSTQQNMIGNHWKLTAGLLTFYGGS